jgi:hypothetical protein
MISLLKKLWKDTSGNILVLAAAAMPVVIGSAGLATDTIQWILIKRQLQRAADSAAIAGAFERQNLAGSSTPELVKVAVDLDLEVNQNTGLDLLDDYPIVDADDPAVTADGLEAIVKVTLAVEKMLPFSSLFLRKAPVIEVSATAASLPGNDDYCVVALGKTEAVGVMTTGSADLNLENCGIMSNSSHVDSAINADGSGTIRATVVAAKGGIKQSTRIIGAVYNPSTSYFDDPYKDLNPDVSDMNCVSRAISDGDNISTIMGPNGEEANCFTSLSVGSNRELNLGSNKTIYINGGDVTLQGVLKCDSCTIILTNSNPTSTAIGNFSANAKADIQITAPSDENAPYRHIAIMQDRRAVSDDGATIQSSKNKINGGAGTGIEGVVYFPSQSLVYLGNANTARLCTKLMGRRVGFTGNSLTAIDALQCGDGFPDWSTGRVIRLIA